MLHPAGFSQVADTTFKNEKTHDILIDISSGGEWIVTTEEELTKK